MQAPAAFSRLASTLKRYFSVKPDHPSVETVAAREATQRAVAAAAANVAANVRLAEELAKLDGVVRPGTQ